MIQRKQTLFLLAVAIIAMAMFFLPFQTYTHTKMAWSIFILPALNFGQTNASITVPFILNIVSLILSVVVMMLYKKRPLQYKLANLLALLNVFLIGSFFLLSFVDGATAESISYVLGAFLPILNIICAYFAAHFIKKDEQLVRSADRIR